MGACAGQEARHGGCGRDPRGLEASVRGQDREGEVVAEVRPQTVQSKQPCMMAHTLREAVRRSRVLHDEVVHRSTICAVAVSLVVKLCLLICACTRKQLSVGIGSWW